MLLLLQKGHLLTKCQFKNKPKEERDTNKAQNSFAHSAIVTPESIPGRNLQNPNVTLETHTSGWGTPT
jgi:hypothetical protein